MRRCTDSQVEHRLRRRAFVADGEVSRLSEDARMSTSPTSSKPTIRVGVGGWTFEPWHTTFYPPGLPATKVLHFASRRLTALEINGTFYSLQKPTTYAKWRDETPEGFVFSVKAHRLTTNRKHLGDGADSVRLFLGSGIAELRDKLGPVLWQLPPYKRFDADELRTFFALLPRELDGRPLRHVLETRHASFASEAYVTLAREHDVGTVFTDSPDYPPLADVTSNVVYLRMMRTRSELEDGCDPAVFEHLAACARAWQRGEEPSGVPRVAAAPAKVEPRDVFMFFISGAKERAPRAAMALRRALGESPDGAEG